MNGVTSCQNIDSCIGNTCAANGDTGSTCYDLNPPSLTYTCGCTAGYTFNPSSGSCEDTDDCVGNPCDDGGDSSATCTDNAPGSLQAYTCTCSSGYEMGNNRTCIDIDRCATNPCIGLDVSATCFDAVPPEDSYSCTCSSTRFRFDGTSCVDNDYCVSDEPCKSDGDMNSTCVDAPWDANITHTCGNCSVGFELSSDMSLCAKIPTKSESPIINFDDGSGQAVVGGAILLLVILIMVVCWYRRRVKKSIAKSEKVLKRAEMELSATNATRDFDELELGGGVICDLETSVTPEDVKALEKAKSRLELENAALRKDNQKHKQKLEKHTLSNNEEEEEIKRSNVTAPVGFGSNEDVWDDGDL